MTKRSEPHLIERLKAVFPESHTPDFMVECPCEECTQLSQDFRLRPWSAIEEKTVYKWRQSLALIHPKARSYYMPSIMRFILEPSDQKTSEEVNELLLEFLTQIHPYETEEELNNRDYPERDVAFFDAFTEQQRILISEILWHLSLKPRHEKWSDYCLDALQEVWGDTETFENYRNKLKVTA